MLVTNKTIIKIGQGWVKYGDMCSVGADHFFSKAEMMKQKIDLWDTNK